MLPFSNMTQGDLIGLFICTGSCNYIKRTAFRFVGSQTLEITSSVQNETCTFNINGDACFYRCYTIKIKTTVNKKVNESLLCTVCTLM